MSRPLSPSLYTPEELETPAHAVDRTPDPDDLVALEGAQLHDAGVPFHLVCTFDSDGYPCDLRIRVR